MRYLLIIVLLFSSQIFSQKVSCFDIARKGTVVQIEEFYNSNQKIIDSVDSHSSSMLILACYRGNTEVAKFLISKNANLDYRSTDGTALMAAVVKGNLEMVTLLLEKKANPNLTDANGVTALMYAVQLQKPELISILLKYKADKTILNKEGITAFEYATKTKNDQIINLLK
jgi:ankyrin repeat protein